MWVMTSVTFLPSPMIATFPGTVSTTFFLSSSLAYFLGSASILTTLMKNWTHRLVGFRTSIVPALYLLVGPDDYLGRSTYVTSCTLEPCIQLWVLSPVSWAVKWTPTFWWPKGDLYFSPSSPCVILMRFIFVCLSLCSQFPSYFISSFGVRPAVRVLMHTTVNHHCAPC